MALQDVFRVDFEMVNDDKVVVTSIHYEEVVVSVGSQAEVTEAICVAAEILFWTNFWKGNASAQLTYLQTTCQQIYPTRQAPFISTALASEVGVGTSDSMNGTTAVVVALYGQIWSPHFRGRAFLPGVGEASADKGRLTTVSLGVIQGLATTFYEASISPGAPAEGGYAPVVYSPTLAGPPAVPPVSNFIETVIVRARIGTQRSRRTPVRSAS